MKKGSIGILIISMLAAISILAQEKWTLPPETAQLKKGNGSDLAAANCMVCHSADYISTQPPMDRKGWEAIVQKMREKYGAPILTNQVEQVTSYLTEAYGRKK